MRVDAHHGMGYKGIHYCLQIRLSFKRRLLGPSRDSGSPLQATFSFVFVQAPHYRVWPLNDDGFIGRKGAG